MMRQDPDEQRPRGFFFNVPPHAFETRQEVVDSFPKYRRPENDDRDGRY